MNINIKKLLDGKVRELDFNGAIKKDFLMVDGKKLKFLEPITLQGKIFKTDNNIYIQGNIEYEYIDRCDRCLVEYPTKKETSLFAEIITFKEKEFDSENLTILLESDFLDFDDIVIKAIYLDLPMKSICNEDCKGFCDKCGKNLNYEKCTCEKNDFDPRLAKLKELINDQGGVLDGSTKA